MKTPSEKFTMALIGLAAAGRRPRCGDPAVHEHWLSEDREERAIAARWCAGCPVLGPCAEAADEHDERFGVWGGVDYTPRTRKETAA